MENSWSISTKGSDNTDQLLKNGGGLRSTLLRPAVPGPVQGQVSPDPRKIQLQIPGAVGRDGEPGLEPGVADDLLHVPGAAQNAPDDGPAVAIVFALGGGDGFLAAVIVQRDDLFICHKHSSFHP